MNTSTLSVFIAKAIATLIERPSYKLTEINKRQEHNNPLNIMSVSGYSSPTTLWKGLVTYKLLA